MNRKGVRVCSKIWLEKNERLVFGEGKSNLLKAIDDTGSIKNASHKMGISFRHGWGYITAIEKRLGCKFIERRKGGKDKGGSRLTKDARDFIKRYDRMKLRVDKFADKVFSEIFYE